MAKGSNTFGGTIKLEGEKEYRDAIKNIDSSLKVMRSEMTKVTAEYGKNNNSMESLNAKNKVLNEQIDAQKEKINNLKKVLEEATLKYGENDKKTNEWKVSLNKAQAELSNMQNDLNKNNKTMQEGSNVTTENSKSINKFGNEVDSASKKTSVLGDVIKGSLISDAIKSGLTTLTNGFKQLGSSILSVGKEALESYGDYEQLVGGVDTLFKDNSSTIQNYANNAYKTAGLNANEYMETVTSFSASLLQSLNNDTAKSAEVADMAITDMSDNANKMGTDMSMIQSAYQGFAKQNYTMLDNLKLGYGGTKTEMERLLSDAQKISGVKYDISNLNDVYSAIHIIQGELGITGTTAKEASTTIQGSMSSLQSSVKNLLTGLANGNADLTGLVSNVVNSALTVADNILPVIEQIANSIVEILPEVLNNIINELPKFLETGSNILTSLISGLQSNMPAIMNAVLQIINMLIKTIIDNLPQLIQTGIQMLLSLIQGIADSLPDLIPTIIDAVILMVTTLLDNIDLIIDAGIQIILGLVDGLIEAMPKLIDKMPEIIDKLITAIVDNLPKLIEAGITLIIKLAEGLIKAIPQIVSKIPQVIMSLINGIGTYFTNMTSLGKELLGKLKDGIVNGISGMLDVGKNLVQGLWNGISNAQQWILDKIKGFGKSILNGIKSFFGINSPSRVFRDEIGKNLALGVGEGFEDEMDSVKNEMQNVLPTDFDVGLNSNLQNNIVTTTKNSDNLEKESKLEMLKEAFKEAIQELKGDVILDDEITGKFVVKKVEEVVYN